MKLHGADLADFSVDQWLKADQSIAKLYTNLFEGYESAMQQLRFCELIRPVHPEFYVNEVSAESRTIETSFTRPLCG